MYRAYGVIRDGVLGEERARGPVRGLSFSSDQLEFHSATCSPSVLPEATRSPLFTPHRCSRDNMQTSLVRKDTEENEGTCTANMGVPEQVQPFSPPVSPRIERLSKGDGSVPPPHSTINAELRVIDLCYEEETVMHKPQQEKPSPEGFRFRSRLRAPRAGRVLVLAAANAKGNPIRQRERSPALSGGLSGKSLEPSPSILTQSAHRKEAWKEEKGKAVPERGGREHRENEPGFSFSEASSGETDIDSNESGTAGYDAAVIPTKEFNDGKGTGRMERSRSEGREDRKSVASMYSDHELPYSEFPREIDDDDRSRRGPISASSDGSLSSQRELNDKRLCIEMSTSPPTGILIDSGECTPIPAASRAHSPRLRSCRPLEARNCYKQGDSRSQVSRIERTSCSQTGALAMPVKPLPQDTTRGGLHLGGNDGKEDSGSGRPTKDGVDAANKARDQEAFVWFGQPDTPPTRQPNECRDDNRAVPSPDGPQQDDRTSPHRQQLSKARLLLQMEVQRQRELIEHAFQQREEEGRLRRARVGAEVLKRIRFLRADCSPLASAPLPSSSPRSDPPSRESKPSRKDSELRYALEQAHDIAESERGVGDLPTKALGASNSELAGEHVLIKSHGIAENGRQAEYLLGSTHVVAENAHVPDHFPRKTKGESEGARSDHPERTIKAWGFGPVDHDANIVKEAPFQLTPDMGASVEDYRRGAPIAPVPTRPAEPLPPSEVDNLGRQVGRKVQEGIAATKAPTPPSISFDVAVDDFSGEQAGLSGGTSEERARRQERYRALRTRKLAEAEVKP